MARMTTFWSKRIPILGTLVLAAAIVLPTLKTSEELHLVMMATFSVKRESLIPTIDELTLMLVNRCWLPVPDPFEQQLLDRLVR